MRELLTLEEYRDELLSLVTPDLRYDDLPLESCFGRVLASPVASKVNIPVFDNSAMDGYAVRYSDAASVPATLRVVAEMPAGSSLEPFIGQGECVRIMTGAPMPDCSDTVVPVEDTDAGERVVTIKRAPTGAGAFVRRVADDVKAGTTIAAAGAECTPYVLGALGAAGASMIRVRPHPLVAVRATGDELMAPGTALGPGQIYESNSLALASALMRDGAHVMRSEPIRDHPQDLVDWLNHVHADLVLLTGGASVGAYDVVRDVLTDAGGTFRHVRMQPGKPQGWALWNGKPVIALPGNPLSAALSYEVFVRPMIDRILGRSSREAQSAVVTSAWQSPPGRRQLVPVRVSTAPDGTLHATPCHDRQSASFVVTSMVGADGYVSVPEEATHVGPGDVLPLNLLRSAR